MKLNDLKHASGARKNRRRIGRGQGSGRGGTSGKGHKGQKSRSGGSIPPWFEGGQMPLARRLPIKGFKNPNRREFEVINIRDIERSGLEGDITVDVLRTSGVVTSGKKPVKLLGTGELSRAVNLKVHAVSASAKQKVEDAGGTVEIVK
ncbi:MAG: 50S ribosomal protein L15 [Candidatus Eisenbacteria bacterium]|nr:50S ribosomal protein L15 [Candidatus Eisenbacteria bacterium]